MKGRLGPPTGATCSFLTVTGIVADSGNWCAVADAQVDIRHEHGRYGALATAVTNGTSEFALSIMAPLTAKVSGHRSSRTNH